MYSADTSHNGPDAHVCLAGSEPPFAPAKPATTSTRNALSVEPPSASNATGRVHPTGTNKRQPSRPRGRGWVRQAEPLSTAAPWRR